MSEFPAKPVSLICFETDPECAPRELPRRGIQPS